MKFSLPSKLKSSKVAANAVAESKSAGEDDNDDNASVGSSLSSRSDDNNNPAEFDNGVVVKAIDETVLLEQAEESLRSALKLIGEAQDAEGSWVDARDLLDRTAAALDDAGLALRGRKSTERSSSVGGGSQNSGSQKSGSQKSGSLRGSTSSKTSSIRSSKGKSKNKRPNPLTQDDVVQQLADEVVDKRRSLLGNVLVHDADGIWTKTQYGEGDGISFGAVGDDFLIGIPEEEKEEKALVVWASQTGTAKKFAKHLYKRLGGANRCVIKSLRDVSVRGVAKHKRVYFVCSTFGMGRPPSVGELFYSLLQLEAMRCKENFEDLSEFGSDESKPLQGTSVAIAALGSSQFKHFAKFGHGLEVELKALGATMAQDVTTLDAAKGKSEQKQAFRVWEETVVTMEKERLMGWVTPRQAKRSSLVSAKALLAAKSLAS